MSESSEEPLTSPTRVNILLVSYTNDNEELCLPFVFENGIVLYNIQPFGRKGQIFLMNGDVLTIPFVQYLVKSELLIFVSVEKVDAIKSKKSVIIWDYVDKSIRHK